MAVNLSFIHYHRKQLCLFSFILFSKWTFSKIDVLLLYSSVNFNTYKDSCNHHPSQDTQLLHHCRETTFCCPDDSHLHPQQSLRTTMYVLHHHREMLSETARIIDYRSLLDWLHLFSIMSLKFIKVWCISIIFFNCWVVLYDMVIQLFVEPFIWKYILVVSSVEWLWIELLKHSCVSILWP